MEKVDDRKSAIKVVITGPESTGKTTLSEELATYYNVSYVKEYAREYLQKQGGRYQQENLLKIAEGQIERENQALKTNPSILILDTSLEVIRVWSEWKYGSCNNFIINNAKARTPDLFLLLKPDFPWQPDPQRENPHDRDELFAYYQKSLSEYNTKVVEISGDADKRITSAMHAIEDISAEY